MSACAGLLEPKGSGLGLLKSTLNAENFIVMLLVVLLYLQPFRRNSVLKCAQHPKIVKNSLKTPFGEVQGHSRSFNVINVYTNKTLACYDKQHVSADLQPFSSYTSQ